MAVQHVEFTKEMKNDYTILVPQMSPVHFEMFEAVLKSEGYKVKLLRDCTRTYS